MRDAILEEWNRITKEEILESVECIPERIGAVIAANGGHTRWWLVSYPVFDTPNIAHQSRPFVDPLVHGLHIPPVYRFLWPTPST